MHAQPYGLTYFQERLSFLPDFSHSQWGSSIANNSSVGRKQALLVDEPVAVKEEGGGKGGEER